MIASIRNTWLRRGLVLAYLPFFLTAALGLMILASCHAIMFARLRGLGRSWGIEIADCRRVISDAWRGPRG